ncbi:hypothetical protein [Acinetobacter wanghuae]|uniref:hypothetical protein n=1 Tax=Acinetobacter wanghuae TaxID=2662362 RepID=UPI003AF87FA9
MSHHDSQDGDIQLIGFHESLSPQLLRMIYSQTDQPQSESTPTSFLEKLINFFKG